MEETFTGHYHNNYVELLVKSKYFTIKFSIRESFFSEKKFFNLYSIILVSFPSGGCVDEAVHSRTNYQGYKYVCFTNILVSDIDSHQFHEWCLLHLMM